MTRSPPLNAETESAPIDENSYQESRTRSDLNRTSLMVLSVDQIQPYERNPRHGSNPEYDRIKASIRNNGLDQPLIITQRLGSTDYIVHSGGNTRLLVLKELYEETGNARFFNVQCLFRPWCRESDVLLAHLRENDLRGSLSFIDKAQAVFEAKTLFAEELKLTEVSQRRLESELRHAGYSVSQGLICQMEYAVCRLLPLIPLALEQGLGRPQVARIRGLERAAATVWQQRCADDMGEFDGVFAALCSRHDGPDWDTDILREGLENEIAEAADISIHTIRVMLDAELAGRELVIPEIEPEPEIELPELENVASTVTGAGAAEERGEPESPAGSEVPGDIALSEQTTHSDSADVQGRDRGPGDDSADDMSHSTAESLITNDEALPSDLKSLRGRAWTLAARLAQRNGIGELIEPLSGKGLGFVLRDVPDPALLDQLDEESLSQISMLWWQLAACAEMTFAPLEAILPLLPADSTLRRSLETQDAELLFKSIWTLDPGHTGYRLWRILDDRDWRDLLNLMDTYRRIRRIAVESGQAVWE